MTSGEAVNMLVRLQDEKLMTTEAFEALQMAIEALGKQIPKKPVGEHYAHMRCPVCNHRIPSGMGSSSRRRDNWCNYCGQKILWGRLTNG